MSIYTLNYQESDTFHLSAGRMLRPKPGESSASQNLPGSRNIASVLADGPGAMGSVGGNLPGFMPPASGSYDTYRQMSSHPTVALAISIVTSPIMANGRSFVARTSEGADRVAFVESVLGPLMSGLVRDGLRALEYGSAPFELVWDRQDGRIILSRIKALIPDYTQVLCDPKGQVMGLRNNPPGGSPVDLLGPKSFLFTHDRQFGDPFGRSRHENIREQWARCNTIAGHLAQYARKVSGLVVQLHYPEGTSRDGSGSERSNDWIAQQILEAVSAGRSVRFQNSFASLLDGQDPRSIEQAANLAGKSSWVLSAFEPGGTDHCPGLLQLLQYLDSQLFQGWLRPARAGLESQFGSRADAEQHTDTGMIDSQLIEREFWDAVNTGIVDPLLEWNFGKQAKGSVYIQPNSPDDPTKENTGRLLEIGLQNPELAAQVGAKLDWDAIIAKQGLPAIQQRRGPIEPISQQQTLPMSLEGDGLLEMANDPDGRWVTINGVHVFTKNEVITKGPASLTGKKLTDFGKKLPPTAEELLNQGGKQPALAGNHNTGLKSLQKGMQDNNSNLADTNLQRAADNVLGSTAQMPPVDPVLTDLSNRLIYDHEHGAANQDFLIHKITERLWLDSTTDQAYTYSGLETLPTNSQKDQQGPQLRPETKEQWETGKIIAVILQKYGGSADAMHTAANNGDPRAAADALQIQALLGDAAGALRTAVGDLASNAAIAFGSNTAGNAIPSIATEDESADNTVQPIAGRMPINSKYAGQTYPLDNLPPDLQAKYPNSVEFKQDGFPDFTPYAKAQVEIEGLTGNYRKDAEMANKAAGIAETPKGYVWNHVEDGKTMQLVPRDIHDAICHTGGAAVIRSNAAGLANPNNRK